MTRFKIRVTELIIIGLILSLYVCVFAAIFFLLNNQYEYAGLAVIGFFALALSAIAIMLKTS